MSTRLGCACAALLLFCHGLAAAADEPYVTAYKLASEARTVDLGLQPLGYPNAMIGAVMRRDRILKGKLERLGRPLATFPFRRGADMVDLLADGRLEAGLLGDMPTIMVAVRARVAIAGLVKSSATSVVSRQEGLLPSLRGKRVAYVPNSSAHYTLLQALASVGMSESDVTLVALPVDKMPAALAQARVDAFAGWEPAPSVALAQSPQARVVFRGLSSDYLVLSPRLIDESPEAALEIVAALARALEWMRASRNNIESAARWAMADGAAFSGRPADLTLERAVAIARREILDIPAAPALPAANAEEKPLFGEFAFLQKLGKLAADARWERVSAAFAYAGLQRVMAAPGSYRPYAFDYEP